MEDRENTSIHEDCSSGIPRAAFKKILERKYHGSSIWRPEKILIYIRLFFSYKLTILFFTIIEIMKMAIDNNWKRRHLATKCVSFLAMKLDFKNTSKHRVGATTKPWS